MTRATIRTQTRRPYRCMLRHWVTVGLLTLAAIVMTRAAHTQEPAPSAVNLGKQVSVLDKFKDCSAELWFDEKRQRLMGSGLDVPVPKQAIKDIPGRYVTIKVRGTFHGFAVEWLLVPMTPQRNDHSGQNSMGVHAKIGDLRTALSEKWGAKFVKSVPDGPAPKGLAFFSDPPQWRPALVSSSHTASRSSIDCAFVFGGKNK